MGGIRGHRSVRRPQVGPGCHGAFSRAPAAQHCRDLRSPADRQEPAHPEGARRAAITLSPGFVSSRRPFNKDDQSRLIKYALSDEYMRFYHAFIRPNLARIRSGAHRDLAAPPRKVSLEDHPACPGPARGALPRIGAVGLFLPHHQGNRPGRLSGPGAYVAENGQR